MVNQTLRVDPWRQALLGVIILSLICAPVSWVDDGITPSWIVYPVVLLVVLGQEVGDTPRRLLTQRRPPGAVGAV